MVTRTMEWSRARVRIAHYALLPHWRLRERLQGMYAGLAVYHAGTRVYENMDRPSRIQG